MTTREMYALTLEAPNFIKQTLKGIEDHVSSDSVIMEDLVPHW